MNWLESLSRTYDSCLSFVGKEEEENDGLLLPLSHTTQNAQIEVTLDENATMIAAKVLPNKSQKTLVPCTESSGGRSGSKPTTHPLCDKLQYLAGDFLKYGGQITSGFSKEPEQPHQDYIKLLTAWQNHSQHPKVGIVLEYVKRGRLVEDLIHLKIIPVTDTGDGRPSFLTEWKSKNEIPPEIYAALDANSSPQDAFVRWAVTIPGDLEPNLWQDASVWESWNNYYRSTQEAKGVCYVTGEITTLAIQHPARIRNPGDKAKIISANSDKKGFYTFRGRFTDKEGLQVCGLSFDVSQKAHNALRWLINRQGWKYGNLAIVTWAITGKPVPDALVSTDNLFDDNEFEVTEINLSNSPLSIVNTGQVVANALRSKLAGYRSILGDTTSIVILALSSSEPNKGRLSINYYRELTSSEFLDRIQSWHTHTAWPQNFGQKRKFIGAPSPTDIALIALGKPREDRNGKKKLELDDKLKAATHRRLLPCIIENRPVPTDLVDGCIFRACSRQSIEHWEWEKALGIACSLYRKQQSQTNDNHYAMSLERNRTTRSYLYGRLLAVADKLEEATYQRDEKRATHAARFTQAFANRPFTTWANIEKSLEPYKRNLATNKPGLFSYFDNELRDIMELFTSEEFAQDEKLDGEFLLAYHCQRTALIQGKKKEEAQPEESIS